MKTIHFEQDDDLIDIRKDQVFKAVFTKETEASRTAFSKLVSALIGREVTILELTINEPNTEHEREKQLRFDINCRAENDERINVEMFFNPWYFEPARLEYHIGKLFTGQEIKGEDKDYSNLKRTYQIAIIAKKRVFQNEEYYHFFEYYDQKNKMRLGGKTQIITLELSKLQKVVEKPPQKMNTCEKWAVFLEYLTDRSKRDKINEILEREEGIAMAGEVLTGFSKNEREYLARMSQEKFELDKQSEMVYARRLGMQQGIEEGRQKGIQEARQEIANLLKSGVSPEEIIKNYG